MLRLFVILTLLSGLLYSFDYHKHLKQADLLLKKNDKSSKFSAYNTYRQIYTKSLESSEYEFKMKSLRGIIHSGSKLNIDTSKYQKKLSNLKKQGTSKKDQILKKTKSKKFTSMYNISSVKYINNRLVVSFDKIITLKHINYFLYHNKDTDLNQYVFSILAFLPDDLKLPSVNEIENFYFKQSSQKMIKLILENKSKIKIRFKVSENRLIIHIKTDKTIVKRSKKNKKIKIMTTPKVNIFNDNNYDFKKTNKGKIIVIDPGHGGKDPGAIGYRRYKEKVIVLDISKKLKRVLSSRGYTVFLTRNNDKFIKLRKRTAFANFKKADLFISIHANAVPKIRSYKAHGVECYFLSRAKSKKAENVAAKENSADMVDMSRYEKNNFLSLLNRAKTVASNKLAIDLQKNILSSLSNKYKDVRDAGVREGPFWVLVGAQMPAVLVEVGFVTYPKEARRLVDKDYQNKLANGLANGIENYFINN